jgi:hypothetical protein
MGAFLWSGANSVHARDSAAKGLSVCLRKNLKDPDATAIIIAHSHGGNVALRALQYLDSSMVNRTRVVTLATPFLRVFARSSLQLPIMVQILLFGAIFLILLLSCAKIMSAISPQDISLLTAIVVALLGTVPSLFITRWLIAVFTNSQAALAIEEAASYDTTVWPAWRMLVIRGVDDEASLSLAAGSIGSRLSYLVLVSLPAINMIGLLGIMFAVLMFFFLSLEPPLWIESVFVGAALCSPMFLFLSGVFKSIFFGREFLLNALICDIAVDSVPDTLGQVEAMTLKPFEAASSKSEWISFISGLEAKWLYRSSERFFSLRWWSDMMRIWRRGWRTGEFLKLNIRFRKSPGLRHRVYNHPACVDEIVPWICRVI